MYTNTEKSEKGSGSSTSTQSSEDLNQLVLVREPDNYRLGITHVLKSIFGESWSYVLARFFAMGTNFGSAFLLGEYDKEILAAAPLINTYQSLTLGSIVGVLHATAVTAGKRIGEGKTGEIGAVFQSSGILALISSIPVIALFLVSKPILLILGQDESVSTFVQQYFFGAAIGVPTSLGFNMCQQLLIGLGHPIKVLLFTMGNAGITLGVGYWLINGGLGLSPQGVLGMGIADAIGTTMSVVLMMTYFKLSKSFKKYQVYSKKKWQLLKNLLKEVVNLGWPIGLLVSIELMTTFGVTVMAGLLGKDALRAMQVPDQYGALLTVAAFGFSQTIAALISREYGRRNFYNARRIGNLGFIMGGVLSTTLCLALIFAYKPLTNLFDSDLLSESGNLIQKLFIITGISEIFAYARYIGPGALRGYYQTKAPTVINVSTMLVLGLGISFLLGLYFEEDVTGIFLGRGIGIAAGAIGNFLLWLYSSNKKMVEDQSQKRPNSENNDKEQGYFSKMLSIFSRKKNKEQASTGLVSEKKKESFFSCGIQ